MISYTFHVSLPGTGRTWRKIELLETQTLAELHLAIQDAFNFDNDHLYAFYMSGKAWDQDSEYRLPDGANPWLGLDDEGEEDEFDNQPEAPDPTPEEREAALRKLFGPGTDLVEMEASMARFWAKVEAEAQEKAQRDVRVVTLASLALSKGQTFLYLFDFGDEWRFRVRVHAITENAPTNANYPRLVETVGKAPRQYEAWDADDW